MFIVSLNNINGHWSINLSKVYAVLMYTTVYDSGQWRHALDLGHAPVFILSFENTIFSRYVAFSERIFSAMLRATPKIQGEC